MSKDKKISITEAQFFAALVEAWDEGWHAAAGWPQIEKNPYREIPRPNAAYQQGVKPRSCENLEGVQS